MADSQDKRPAYEELFDRPFGGNAPEKHIGKFFAHIAVFVMWLVCKVCFRFHVDGREKLYEIADKTGVVVVCNHTSYLDVVLMYLSVRPKYWARIIGRNTLFDGKPYIFGWILAHVGVFPIHRETADRTAIKRAAKMLKNGEVVCILPEGTRRDKGTMKPEIHGGAAFIARMGHAPIVPMTVRDAENVKRKGERFHFPKITVEFGDPVDLDDFDFLPKNERLDGCVWYAMRECFALSKRIEPDQVDMVALFPDGRDFTEDFAGHKVPHHTPAEMASKYGPQEAGD